MAIFNCYVSSPEGTKKHEPKVLDPGPPPMVWSPQNSPPKPPVCTLRLPLARYLQHFESTASHLQFIL